MKSLKNIEIKETENGDSTIATETIENVDSSTLRQLYQGDLYVVGKLWINAVQLALIGKEINIFPVVSAAKKTETPQRPPKMKYTDLPLYDAPHYEYKEYECEKDTCPERNVKLLHRYLQPSVTELRKSIASYICQFRCTIRDTYASASTGITNTKNEFKQKMRDPSNLTVRQGVVAVGGVLGFLVGGGGGIPRRLFYTSAGLLSTGSLCFPKDTDEIFRDFAYVFGKAVIAFYNGVCFKNYNLRERVPCSDDIPPPPPPRPPLQCPPKK